MAKEKKDNAIKRFFAEFKKFITRGNVLDMAVGVIVGGAFTAIVNGLSDNILKPLINFLIAKIVGNDGFENAITMLSPAYQLDANGNKVLDLANSIYLDWGAVITAIINFLITAFVLFLIVRTINKVAENNKTLAEEYTSGKRQAIREIRKAERVSGKVAKAIYEQRKADAEAQAAAEAKAKEEAEKAAAEEAARIAEEKANAPTVLLGEIRALLERIAPPLPETEEGEEGENAEGEEKAEGEDVEQTENTETEATETAEPAQAETENA